MLAIDRESYEALHELNALYKEFRGTRCFCGNVKTAGQPFCDFCLELLPDVYGRTHLFSPHKQQFQVAYESAKGWLRAHGVHAAKQWADERGAGQHEEPDLEMMVWALAPDDGRHSGVKRRKCKLREVPTGWQWEACED